MKERFRGLRLVALVSKAIGWLILLAGLILGALIVQGILFSPLDPLAEPYSTSSLMGAAALFVPFLLGFLLLYGSGGVLQVLLAIEKNTRTAQKPGDDEPGQIPPGPPEVPT